MKNRCFNPKEPSFKNYGARGITVCNEWNDSFEAFHRDMGDRPSPKHTIERIDNEGPYASWNCRWALPSEQANNTRKNHFLAHDGKTMTVAEWARELGLPLSAIRGRLKWGWSAEDALTKPLRKDRRRKT